MTEATATPTPGLEEVIDLICPQVCSGCGKDLPRPGAECAGCGELPRLLRAEAAEQLSEPGALAARQAEHHRRQAARLLDEAITEHLAADRPLFLGRLRLTLDRAEAGLTAAVARHDQAGAPLKGGTGCRGAAGRGCGGRPAGAGQVRPRRPEGRTPEAGR